ncbi:MAG: adenylyl-sulfate kinase [Bacteroidetes bacterium]|nr:adenylyl-sulfate kinase [Bacteroidota bacterium]
MHHSNHRNLYPTVCRDEKQKRLGQHSKVIWLTGLPAAGKTTIAINLEKELHKRGFFTQLLDGDIARTGINSDLGFSDEDRYENIRRIAEISRLFIYSGIITINSFISPTEEIRTMAKRIIGNDDFIEIFVNAPLEICESRDPKGLYAKARSGQLKNFTGIQSPFEIPVKAHLEIRTDLFSIQESVQQILDFIIPQLEYTNETSKLLITQ